MQKFDSFSNPLPSSVSLSNDSSLSELGRALSINSFLFVVSSSVQSGKIVRYDKDTKTVIIDNSTIIRHS